jgi:parallel beta-helix repeat protein
MPHRTIRPPVAVDLDTAHDRRGSPKAYRMRVALLATTGFLGALLSLLLIALFLPATQDAADAQTTVCHKYASPSGSAQQLVDSLSSGQVGCLRGGIYTDGDGTLTIRKAGITLRSAPAQQATIKAQVYVPEGTPRVTVSNLKLEGAPGKKANVLIRGDYTRWLGNDVTNGHRPSNCFLVGSYSYGRATATGTLIQGNRIHDCGRMPRTNHDHGIYASNAVATVIRDNQIYNNADRGVQLYPSAQRTLVEGNVINANGQGVLFGGSSSNNTVRGNVISNSVVGYNVYALTRSGSGNLVMGNCLWKSNGISGLKAGSSLTARNNVVANPSSSQCRSVL